MTTLVYCHFVEKFEFRISKIETNPNTKCQKFKTRFEHSDFGF
jgi:hypothetical protein